MNPFWNAMCDELIRLADTDLELKFGLDYIDGETLKGGIGLYERIAQIVYGYKKAELN